MKRSNRSCCCKKLNEVGCVYAEWASSASYEDVRDGVIKAHARTFPFSACPRQCLKEQLDDYYKKCGKLTVKKIGKFSSSESEDGSVI